MDPGRLLAVETRSGHAEVLHLGHAVLLAADGEVLATWGDAGCPTYWRSTAKPLQAIPFSHVRQRFGLGPEAVALACGSHIGEAVHAELAERMLRSGGLSPSDLTCGVHPPWSPHSGFTAEAPGVLHNNCSGCHAAALLACVAEGLETQGYASADHPLQQRLLRLAEEASGGPVEVGVDGCGMPTYRTPLSGLARAYQWLLAHEPAVLEAMARHPRMVGGTDEFDTVLMQLTGGRIVGKFGALGVYAAVDRVTRQAVAVRVTTGNEMVCESVAGRILLQHRLVDEAMAAALEPKLRLPVVNNLGDTVGEVSFLV